MRLYQIFTRLFANPTLGQLPNGTRSQNGCGTFEAIDDAAIAYIKNLNVDTVWLTGVLDHACLTDYAHVGKPSSHPDVVKGKAGSPYAIRDFLDVAPDLSNDPANRMAAFEACLGRLKQAGLKLIIDFVPNHTARSYSDADDPKHPAFSDDKGEGFHADNFYFYLEQNLHLSFAEPTLPFNEKPAKATGNDAFTCSPSRNDWYETVKINYGRHPLTGEQRFAPIPKTWHFMLGVLSFWAAKGVDGFRCDMVDMIPIEFWQWALAELRSDYPSLTLIGESYIPTNYKPLIDAGFDYLYDKVGLYDTMLDVIKGKAPAHRIGQVLWDTRGAERHLLRFTENHDEVRLPSKQGLASLEAAVAVFFLSAMLSPQAVMLYAGQELGEDGAKAEGFSSTDGKTTIFDYWTLDHMSYLMESSWAVSALPPVVANIHASHKAILGLHQQVEKLSLNRVYNLHPANLGGYGAASADHIFCGLLLQDRQETNEALFFACNLRAATEHCIVIIPSEAIERESLDAQYRVASVFNQTSDRVMTDRAALSFELQPYGCLAIKISAG